jgi:hypothetical protein
MSADKDQPAGEFRIEDGTTFYVVDGTRVAERVGEGEWVTLVPGWRLEDAYSGQTGRIETLVFYDPDAGRTIEGVKLVRWTLLYPGIDLGLLEQMLDANDPRPAREQFDANYQHGGGWFPIEGVKLLDNDCLKYPGDPPFRPLAEARLRDELIRFYEHDLVAIIQPDRRFEVARMD